MEQRRHEIQQAYGLFERQETCVRSRSPTRTVVRECCKVDEASQKGKLEIRPLAKPKPLNRSSQKVAHVITSRISTDLQNLVAIPPGVSFPHMRDA